MVPVQVRRASAFPSDTDGDGATDRPAFGFACCCSDGVLGDGSADREGHAIASGDGFPLRVAIGKPGWMAEETDLLVDQIRTSSTHRLLGAKPVAVHGAYHMKRVMDAFRSLTT